MNRIFIFFQYIIPQHLLSRCTGWLAHRRGPRWLVSGCIRLFIRHFGVDMQEADNPDPASYASFNAFFTRQLKPGVRPLAEADVVCPADGAISQIGNITAGRVFQAKGMTFSARELLGGDAERAAVFEDGVFTTIYLSPRDYHRVHMPLAGRLTATCYVPGQLFSVNAVTAASVPRLFARNERLVCHFDTAAGPMAMVLVGAMIVAGIETVWSGQIVPPSKLPQVVDYDNLPSPVELEKGEEMGRFLLGSTVILLFPRDAVAWGERYTAGSPTRLGEMLGIFVGRA